ncbi:MAG: M20/M25/M40 family metallo-hydrolase [Methanobacteriota archaeon]
MTGDGQAGRFLETLVRIPSPTGHEDAAGRSFAEEARRLGFEAFRDEVGNTFATAGNGPVRILLAGHIDTVPGDIPVRVEDGVLWGRGAVDAKGPLVAFLYGAAVALGTGNEGRGTRKAPSGPPSSSHVPRTSSHVTVILAALVGEEGDSRGAKHVLSSPAHRARRTAHHVIVGEPSSWDGITLGYKGSLDYRVEATRPRRHGGHPAPNAAEDLLDCLQALRALGSPTPTFDALSVRIHGLAAREEGLATHAAAVVNLRTPPGFDRAPIEKLFATYDVRATLVDVTPAVLADRDTEVARALRGGIRESGGTPRLLRKTGTADMNLLARLTPSIVAYGPGDSALDHTADERLDLAELERGVAVVASAIRRLADG